MNNRDPRYSNNFIDANVFDENGGLEGTAADRIWQLYSSESDLKLLLPYSVKAEIEHPNTPAGVKQKAERLIYTQPVDLTEPELVKHRKVGALIQGNAQPGQHEKDAFHLVESAKYGAYFITNDGRLLKKAEEIHSILGLHIVKPSEFLAIYLAHRATRSGPI